MWDDQVVAGACAGIKAAADGFVVSPSYAAAVHGVEKHLHEFEGSRAVFFHADGKPIAAGDRLVQTDLANTYRQMAEHGTDWFYRGEFANKIGEWMTGERRHSHGGRFCGVRGQDSRAAALDVSRLRDRRLSAAEFGRHACRTGAQHSGKLRSCGRSTKSDPLAATHITAEAFKLAFADRAYWLGDADFVNVPRGLIDKGYAKELAAKIDPKQAIDVATHGSPPNYSQDVFGRHTTHIAAADAAGNWVAITATVNTTFGSKVIVPGTGVVLNDEMDDFSIFPGMPNAFGLVGAENNSVGPGKRPLSSMSPTIVLDYEWQAGAHRRARPAGRRSSRRCC